MPRIEPDRVGYDGVTGFACIGIPIPDIESPDCTGNKYKKLPMVFYGGMNDIPWEDLDSVFAQLEPIKNMCDLDYDPFYGFFMDLYNLFLDAGMGHIIADDCYEPPDMYSPGYMNPYPGYKIAGAPCPTKHL